MTNQTRSQIAEEVRYAIHLDESIQYFRNTERRLEREATVQKSIELLKREMVRVLELIDTLLFQALDRGENVTDEFDADLEYLEAEYRPVR